MVATTQLVTLSALTLTHLPAMDYMVWLPSCPVFWLVASDSNRAHSWLTAKCHLLDDSLPLFRSDWRVTKVGYLRSNKSIMVLARGFEPRASTLQVSRSTN
jgi:hypothetical protein